MQHEDRPGIDRLIGFLQVKTGLRMPAQAALACVLGPDFAHKDAGLSDHYNRYRFIGDKLLNAACGELVSCAVIDGSATIQAASESYNEAVSRESYGQVFVRQRFLHAGEAFLRKQEDMCRVIEKPSLRSCGERLEAVAGAMYVTCRRADPVIRFGRSMLERHIQKVLAEGVRTLEERVRAHLEHEGVPHSNGATLSFSDAVSHGVHIAHLLFDGVRITTGSGHSKANAQKQALREVLADRFTVERVGNTIRK